MITLLIQALVILAVIGIFYWATTKIPLPPPVLIVVQVALAILAIVMLCGLAGWGPGARFRFR